MINWRRWKNNMSKNLIVIDVQPFYHNWHKGVTVPLINHIEKNKYDDILWFFNAEDVGIDDKIFDVHDYLLEYGMDDNTLDEITFIDKYYSFFRNWMDAKVDEDFIVRVVKYMIKNNIHDSIDIEDFAMEMMVSLHYDVDLSESEDWKSDYDFIFSDMISIPQFKWEAIRNLGSVDICGGGRNECLKEMVILLKAVGVKVNYLDKLIYGE